MTRKSAYKWFVLSILLSCKAYTGSLTQGLFTLYNFAPNTPVIITNTLPSTTKAQCVVNVVNTVNHSLFIEVLKGQGEVNGTSLKQGQSLVLTANNSQVIPILASPGAQARFTNLGPYEIKADCSLTN